jgi:hypothetical protein
MLTATTHLLMAYLDPGTGSIVVQLLVAGLAGFAYVLKLYWRRMTTMITSLVSRRTPEPKKNGPPTLEP